MSERYKSVNQISEMTGIDRRTIKKKIADIPIHSKAGRAELYDMFTVAPRLFASETPESTDKKLKAEQLRYEQARADKMQIEVEQKRGQLVAIHQVAEFITRQFGNVRSRILSIPSRCAKDLSIESDPALVRERLEQETREALAELTADQIYEEMQDAERMADNTTEGATESAEATAETEPS